jgi:glycine cleavage system H protein
MSATSSYRISPPEQRCVWMTAGVLTYQLCDRNFECAGCTLDASLRNAYVRPETVLPLPVDRIHLRPGRFYTSEHCWVDVLGPHRVRIGVEPGFAKRLAQADGISLPPVGKELKEREAAVWCRFDDAMVPVRLPFDLRVSESNRAVRSNPSLLATDPYDQGWLLEADVQPEHLDGQRVMSAREAEKIYQRDEEAFRSAIAVGATSGLGVAGPTMQDGGEPALTPLAQLGAARYCALVGKVYCKIV